MILWQGLVNFLKQGPYLENYIFKGPQLEKYIF